MAYIARKKPVMCNDCCSAVCCQIDGTVQHKMCIDRLLDSFTKVLLQTIRRLRPCSRLGKDAACQNFTEVLPRFAVACNITVNSKTR